MKSINDIVVIEKWQLQAAKQAAKGEE